MLVSLIFFVVIVAAAVAGAELVRGTCTRMLRPPAPRTRPASVAAMIAD